jgi:uncharacterized membrane protein YdbT with pleckstrin-like domain
LRRRRGIGKLPPAGWQARLQAMRYVARVLQPDETVVLHTHLHPIIYLYALWYVLITIALFIASYQVNSVEIHIILQVAALIFLLFAAAAWLRAAIRQWTTELAVTDRRVIYKSGLISRHTLEMNRSKIESVDVDQSLLGRVLSFGTIVVRGTGGSLEPIRLVRDPLHFRSCITAG